MKSFGFKQLKRKEGPSFYLKGFQRTKSQWGRPKLKSENQRAGSLKEFGGSEGMSNLDENMGGSAYDNDGMSSMKDQDSEYGDQQDRY